MISVWSLYLLLSVLLGACQSEQGTSLPGTSPDKSADWTSLLSLESFESATPGPLEFPVDLFPHPNSRSESLVLEALLHSADGSDFSVQVQIDRAALKQTTTTQSDWAYTDVMRASLTIGRQDEKALNHRESISRLALGLAGSDANTLYVGDTSITIRQQDACKAQFTASGTTGDGRLLSLNWYLTQCPRGQSVAGFNQWSAAGVEVAGQVMQSGTLHKVSGQGWMLKRFGNLPTPGGAVIFDEIRLVLDDRLLLTASRSRRRSGRGPQTIVSSIELLDSGTVAAYGDIDLQWIDEGDAVSEFSGERYPRHIRLIDADQKLSLQLTPLLALPEVIDRLGVRWNGAVRVSGSHSGYGFVNMSPMLSGVSR